MNEQTIRRINDLKAAWLDCLIQIEGHQKNIQIFREEVIKLEGGLANVTGTPEGTRGLCESGSTSNGHCGEGETAPN